MANVFKSYWAVFISIITITTVAILRTITVQAEQFIAALKQDFAHRFIYWHLPRGSAEYLIIPIGAAAIILIWIVIRLLKRNLKIDMATKFSILGMLVLSIAAIAIVFFSGMGEPAFVEKHIASAQIRDINYHLIEVYGLSTNDAYVLVRCGVLNTNCLVAFVDDKISPTDYVGLKITSVTNSAVLELLVNDYGIYSPDSLPEEVWQ